MRISLLFHFSLTGTPYLLEDRSLMYSGTSIIPDQNKSMISSIMVPGSMLCAGGRCSSSWAWAGVNVRMEVMSTKLLMV